VSLANLADGLYKAAGTEQVAEGWALAYRQYSRDYVSDETEARSAGLNIWTGTFVMPWNWRRGAHSL
jgi:endonuclease YncB( thermonuclease family)